MSDLCEDKGNTGLLLSGRRTEVFFKLVERKPKLGNKLVEYCSARYIPDS
jgi:hypothetical protein